MSFGGFLEAKQSGGGGRIVSDIPYSNGSNHSNDIMPSGAISQPRLATPTLAKSMFNSPGLSLALQSDVDGQGDMNRLMPENFEQNGLRRSREEEHESRSGSDNMDGASGDDFDAADNPPRKKRYHRHTPQQIQELEALFKECPHPDEKQRLELSRRLNLETRQVKFWFQNRRTQMKTQLERHENSLLRQENDKLRAENMSMREAMRNPMCSNCGGPAMIGEISLEEQHLRIENARLKDELDRVCALAGKFLGRPISSLTNSIGPPLPNSSLELGVGSNGFGGLSTVPSTLPDFGVGISSPLAMMSPSTRPTATSTVVTPGLDRSVERSIVLELALAAMDELVKMAQTGEPLWIRSLEGGREILNYEEYTRTMTPCIGLRPNGFVTEASRQNGMVIINSLALVETLMDSNRWSEMFPCMIARTSTAEVISNGINGTRNGALQLMHAELQVLSPLVPVREVNFLRFCKQHAEGLWAVVDVSIDTIRETSGPPTFVNCRRLPSGCVVQDMPNGYSKVTWVEHAEYDESQVHQLYRPLLSSGTGFGAQRWVATLQRQCECLAILMSSAVPSREHSAISSGGRRSMLKLAQRMTNNFCAGVCASTVHKWNKLNAGNVGEDVRVMTRKSVDDPGEPPGIVLSAATSVWLPVSAQRLFDFLRDERLRSEWDILSNGGPMQEMAHIAKGQDHANCVSLLRASAMNANQSSMLILQETCTDASGSLVVYAPVDIPAMHVVMNGGDSAYVALLPSGFAIVPDGSVSGGEHGGASQKRASGCLLTVAFQILVNSLPTAKLTVESVETVNNLIKVPIALVFEEDIKSLGSAWYSLKSKNKKCKNKQFGEIHLSIFISQSNGSGESNDIGDQLVPPRKCPDAITNSPSMSSVSFSNLSSPVREDTASSSSKEEKSCMHQKSFAGRIAQIFNKGTDVASMSPSRSIDSDQSETCKVEVGEIKIEEDQAPPIIETFEETMKKIQSAEQGSEIPSNLSGGVLIDQLYIVAPRDLNALLFSPDSNFPKALADLQGTTELQVGPWKLENGVETSKRSLSYLKAPTKLIKAVKGYEDQTYLKADGKNFAVFACVSTPDVMYGSTFKVELLYVITPGPELPSGEQCSRLVISWRMIFVQSTMMKGMIESGARQGMRESFDQYAILLCQTVKAVVSKDLGSSKEQALATLRPEPQSDWRLALQYLANFKVFLTFLMVMSVFVHMWLASPSGIQGLEFFWLDLPDSIGELVVCVILVLQGEKVVGLISRFMQARARKGSDHGIKAQGEGWMLTVAIIEGSNLATLDSKTFCDPYVVFTCNGKTRTSSVKFKKSNPLWNEIFEFDAMDDPPSVLDVDVYDFDGPFDDVTALGHVEINFLKTNISDLADIWVSLEGKWAQASQSKLHLRIFLNNTRRGDVVKHYISKMEKEVGKKINLRSPQTNSAFQKLFGLPPEEFLINDFTCHLKRKMPLQGRLFVSARIIGFHANLFGHKTKFFLLWEDIEDIQIIPPTFSSMGSPIIVVTLWPGRGVDARHGAKTQDEDGRLKFRFQSFVSFNVANRTIMALWKARSLSPEQKVQLVEEDSETKSLRSDESGSFIGLGDVSMSEVHSGALSVPASFLMELFSGGELDRMFMEKSGCVNYSYTPWVSENSGVYERAVYYKFEKRISRYRVEVTSTQQKSILEGKGWLLQEVMNFHGVPLGDFFNLHIRYQIEDLTPKACKVQVLFGTEWLKSTKHQKRITKNILKNLQERLKLTFSLVEKEFLAK